MFAGAVTTLCGGGGDGHRPVASCPRQGARHPSAVCSGRAFGGRVGRARLSHTRDSPTVSGWLSNPVELPITQNMQHLRSHMGTANRPSATCTSKPCSHGRCPTAPTGRTVPPGGQTDTWVFDGAPGALTRLLKDLSSITICFVVCVYPPQNIWL